MCLSRQRPISRSRDRVNSTRSHWLYLYVRCGSVLCPLRCFSIPRLILCCFRCFLGPTGRCCRRWTQGTCYWTGRISLSALSSGASSKCSRSDCLSLPWAQLRLSNGWFEISSNPQFWRGCRYSPLRSGFRCKSSSRPCWCLSCANPWATWLVLNFVLSGPRWATACPHRPSRVCRRSWAWNRGLPRCLYGHRAGHCFAALSICFCLAWARSGTELCFWQFFRASLSISVLLLASGSHFQGLRTGLSFLGLHFHRSHLRVALPLGPNCTSLTILGSHEFSFGCQRNSFACQSSLQALAFVRLLHCLAGIL